MPASSEELAKIYQRRFTHTSEYRNAVWKILIPNFFQRWVQPKSAVLDLGCGYGEFINNVNAAEKFAMDLNADAGKRLAPGIRFIQQDCSAEWQLPENSLDVVFTSNFFEHLPDKRCLSETLRHALRSLKPGGLLIALGPNIKYLHGIYWDFYDHHLYLTDLSLVEGMEMAGFQIDLKIARFLPFTLVDSFKFPLFFVNLYLLFPPLWRIFGRQFLVVAKKPL